MNEFDRTDAMLRSSADESLEAQLKQLQPVGPSTEIANAAELFYRCGWTAARAQHTAELGEPSSSSAVSWRAFGVGGLTGIAACLLTLVIWGGVSGDPDSGSKLVAGSAVGNASGAASTSKDSIDERNRDAEDASAAAQTIERGSDSYAMTLPLFSMPLRHGLALEQPIVVDDGGRWEQGNLSSSAIRNWRSVFTSVSPKSALSKSGSLGAGKQSIQPVLRARSTYLNGIEDLL